MNRFSRDSEGVELHPGDRVQVFPRSVFERGMRNALVTRVVTEDDPLDFVSLFYGEPGCMVKVPMRGERWVSAHELLKAV